MCFLVAFLYSVFVKILTVSHFFVVANLSVWLNWKLQTFCFYYIVPVINHKLWTKKLDILDTFGIVSRYFQLNFECFFFTSMQLFDKNCLKRHAILQAPYCEAMSVPGFESSCTMHISWGSSTVLYKSAHAGDFRPFCQFHLAILVICILYIYLSNLLQLSIISWEL